MRKIFALAGLTAALCGAEVEAEEFAPGTDNSATISMSAGYQDNDLNNGYDFTEGMLARLEGVSAVTFYNDAQLVFKSFFEAGSLRYSDGGGDITAIDAEFSQFYEWAPRWSSFGLNLGAGMDFDCLYETGSYDGVPLASTICSAGPAIDFAIDSEYASFWAGYSIGFGIIGNNVQGHHDLIKHKLKTGIGFHIWPLDIAGHGSFEYNTAAQGKIDRSNLFITAGAFGRLWLDESFALQAGYEHDWTFFDVDNIEGDSFVIGLAARF